MAFSGAIIRRIWPEFPLNSQWIGFITSITCSIVYVVVSLIEGKTVDMDRMLHRGKYAIKDDIVQVDTKPVRGIRALLAMGNEFTRWDKAIYIASLTWSLSLCIIFVIGVIYNLIFDVPTDSWAKFWWYYVIIYFILSILTTVWFIIGGAHDYVDMFNLLKQKKVDETDDGRVID